MHAKPLEIPGTSIRVPDKPGSKQCPHCKHNYKAPLVEKRGKKIVYLCPRCHEEVN